MTTAGRHGQALWLVLSLACAVFFGLLASYFPLSASIALGVAILLPIFVLVAWLAPPLNSAHYGWLSWGLCISLFLYFVWPRNAFLPLEGLPVKHPQRLFYLIYLASWAFILIKSKALRAHLNECLLATPLLSWLWLALFAWQLLSAISSTQPPASIGALSLDFLVVYLLYPVVICSCKDVKSIARLINTLILAAAVNVIYATPEYILKRNIFESLITLDQLNPKMAEQILSNKFRGGFFRAQGSFDHPLLFAEFLVVVLPFVIVAAIVKQQGKLPYIAAAGLFALGLVLCHSRIAIAVSALCAIVLVALILIRSVSGASKDPRPLVWALFGLPLFALACVLAFDFLGAIAQGRSQDEASSSFARMQMLLSGLQLVMKEPIFGYGPGSAGLVLNFKNTFGVMTLDNYILSLALDSGIVAAIFWASAIATAFYCSAKLFIISSSSLRSFALPICASLAAFFCVKFVLGTGLNNLLAPALFGVIATMRRQQVYEVAYQTSSDKRALHL